ncbi:MAG: LysR family transcriptional regulator [Oscillospiraceae bacterium]|nr:LysR family transcriptional regulator [Oscillospiraceae bacterium]
MEFYQLEYFRVLCKHGSYTSAARELNVSQPTVSMAIKRLEGECGEIIDHRRKAFALTKRGEKLLSWAVVFHNNMETMLQDIGMYSSRQREIIRFSFPMPLCPELMTDVLPAFSQHHSDVALHTIQAGHLAIAAQLTEGRTDLGILCQDMLTPGLEFQFYKNLEFWACLSPTHPLNGRGALTPEQLAGETLLLPKVENSISAALPNYFRSQHLQPSFVFEDIYPEDVWQLASQGKGVAFVPKHRHGKYCAPLCPPLYSRLVIAWRKGEVLTQRKKELISYIIQAGDDSAQEPSAANSESAAQ